MSHFIKIEFAQYAKVIKEFLQNAKIQTVKCTFIVNVREESTFVSLMFPKAKDILLRPIESIYEEFYAITIHLSNWKKIDKID